MAATVTNGRWSTFLAAVHTDGLAAVEAARAEAIDHPNCHDTSRRGRPIGNSRPARNRVILKPD
jgi:hypothetical protein